MYYVKIASDYIGLSAPKLIDNGIEVYHVDSLGRKQGIYRKYINRDNKDLAYLCIECIYRDGVLNGLYQEYYHDLNLSPNNEFFKRLCLDINYVDGVKHGKERQIKYNEDMAEISEVHYVKGLKQGLFQKIKGSAVVIECNYLDDKIDGLYKEVMGNLITNINYKGGLRDGNFNEFFKHNMRIAAKGNYFRDMLTGIYERFDETGIKRMECNYYEGKLSGTYKIFDSTGRLYEKTEYYDGKKHGICKIRDINGFTYKQYTNGIETNG